MLTVQQLREEINVMRAGQVHTANDPRFKLQHLCDVYEVVADLMERIAVLEQRGTRHGKETFR